MSDTLRSSVKRLAQALGLAVLAGAALAVVRQLLSGRPTPPPPGAELEPHIEQVHPTSAAAEREAVETAAVDDALPDSGPGAADDAVPDDPGVHEADATDAPPHRGADAEDPAWVEPIDGSCPVTHPVKLKAASGIFHVPGGANYDRTTPDRCYRSADAAEADGYRAAKR